MHLDAAPGIALQWIGLGAAFRPGAVSGGPRLLRHHFHPACSARAGAGL